MNTYIGSKIIKAEPMGKNDFQVEFKGSEAINSANLQEAGYHVLYEDGYHSWSPKLVFETAYRLLTEGEFNLLN